MSFTVFEHRFTSAFPELRKKHRTLYAWEKFFLDMAEQELCIPHETARHLSRCIKAAFEDKLEGSDERDQFEAIMLCMLDLVNGDGSSKQWPQEAITSFMSEIVKSHFDAYLLYKSIRPQSKA